MKSKFIKQLFEPFSVICDYKQNFILWFVFTIITGQLGIIINIIVRTRTSSYNMLQSIIVDSLNGSFHIFSIALIASALGLIFINFVETQPTRFKSIKIGAIIISIFILFFNGIYYSISANLNQYTTEIIDFSRVSIDLPQLFFYVASFVLAIYIYSLNKMDLQYPKFAHLDNTFSEEDDKAVKSISIQSNATIIDREGNKL